MTERNLIRNWGMVVVLQIFLIVSFVDRTVISMMVEPIEHDLHLSEFQMSLLLGPAFALPHLLFSLPMGWLVDRIRTRPLLSGGIATWGVSTMVCGLATKFLTLLLARMGVGIGEAVMTPAAHATIAQRFPPRRLALAISVFTIGAPIGSGLALTLGGILVHFAESQDQLTVPLFGSLRAWQTVFLAVGGLTIALMPLVLLLPNVNSETPCDEEVSEANEGEDSFLAILRRYWRYFLLLPVGFGCINVINSAYGAWVPTFMIRSYGWNPAEVGSAWGLQHLIAISAGGLVNATLIDRFYSRGIGNAHAIYPIIAVVATLPALIWAFLSGDGWMFILLTGLFYFFALPFTGYASAAMQLFTPQRWRGRMSALFIAIVAGIAPSIGAPVVGILSDTVFGKENLGYSLLAVTLIFAPLAILILFVVGCDMKRLHAARHNGEA